jgi:hypothetical protein
MGACFQPRNLPRQNPGRGLTFEQAKAGLAKRYGVRPEAVEITIRG